ncbi:Flagellar L-ring protein [Buchnera aphidicola (Tuberolachnus salignus)]|uniref:Flagellar L-ring protein n=1 Tax=Buchnera aphidicola subsp. Tuberolachnus salignus TaxID=98804 RepID=A0A160SWK3_BUCTT|nr:flagellar basal body L-ring protein FlgH [Buchnera aphidicola]CUR53202.1 Flagellar L-ring protein [Buchnera aphidicola (Tuberolachnus salignus)]
MKKKSVFKHFIKILKLFLLILSLFFLNVSYSNVIDSSVQNTKFTQKYKNKEMYKRYYYHNWFEDHPQYQIGDNITVFLHENIMAKNKTYNNLHNTGKNFLKIQSFVFYLINKIFQKKKIHTIPLLNTIGNKFSTDTNRSIEKNTFIGLITVTIKKILPNRNLQVSGKNSIFINGNIESIYFSGVLNPNSIKHNKISSSKVSHKYIQYTTRKIKKKTSFLNNFKKKFIKFFYF